MVYGIKLIGNDLLKMELVKDFKETYEKLSKPKNDFEFDLLQKFFYLSKSLSFQFDGFICIFESLKNENPDGIKQYEGFQEFITEKCAPLAFISYLIIFPLNNHILDGEVFNIIETPYDNFFDRNLAKDEFKLKKCFEFILNCNVDTLFSNVISLRDDFFSSNLFNGYINALKTDGDIKKYEIAVQAFFYIIKQIIYQIIIYGHISFINENDIIKISRINSLERDYFKIKYQPSRSLNNFVDVRNVIELNHRNKEELGLVTFRKARINQVKGTIIDIEMEILSKEGLNINSPTSEGINKFYNEFGHMLRFIDDTYRGIE